MTAVAGVVFLASLLAPRPLIFQFGRQAVASDPAAAAQWDTRWEAYQGFRDVMRLMTAVWGTGLLFEALVRTVAAFKLPPAISSVVSPVCELIVTAGLIVWTIAYAISGGAARNKSSRKRRFRLLYSCLAAYDSLRAPRRRRAGVRHNTYTPL